VDADGTESVDAEAVSIVPSAPATSLAGAASGGGGGGGGCFISAAQIFFNRDGLLAWALVGFMVILGLMIKGHWVQGLMRKVKRG
jgi:hypothetical protein